jgi:hypothetical protein
MYLLCLLCGILLIVIVLADAFETMILPRTAARKVRLTRFFYYCVGRIQAFVLGILGNRAIRDTLLNIYAPLSLIGLLLFWAIMLILGFALVQYGLRLPLSGNLLQQDIGTYLYFSGVTFLTLGFGDITSYTGMGRFLSVLEAGVGFGFLAVVISYLPVLYQSFSRREVTICMLDARAGSPPTAAELLRRHGHYGNMQELFELLKEYERWAAELLESYLSYPILAFYRSQHDQQSWLSAMVAILDTCTLLRLRLQGDPAWQPRLQWQAYLTFAMARHTLIDLVLILFEKPKTDIPERLSESDWQRLTQVLAESGMPLERIDAETREQFNAMRQQYEPFAHALAQRLFLELPPWVIDRVASDNWQTSTWEDEGHLNRRTRGERP